MKRNLSFPETASEINALKDVVKYICRMFIESPGIPAEAPEAEPEDLSKKICYYYFVPFPLQKQIKIFDEDKNEIETSCLNAIFQQLVFM